MSDPLSLLAFNEEDARTLALGLTFVASQLVTRESDPERKQRKVRAVKQKMQVLRATGLHFELGDIKGVLHDRVRYWEEPKRNALLVELAFADPFAPYELKVAREDMTWALETAALFLGLSTGRVKEVQDAIRSARKAHRHIDWGKIGVGAVVGAIVLATGGYLAAPLLAGALGGAAGLSGAAAVAHGLALLGGGSLAAGGAGMAGGLIAVTAGGAAVGGVGLGGAVALWSAGYSAALSELVKLQVSYREVLLRSQLRGAAAARIVVLLNERIVELKEQLARERSLNDPGARRVEELERIERAYHDALTWIAAPEPQA